MSDFEKLHKQADRLLALALKAREGGYIEQAEQLTKQAAEYLDRAMELSFLPPAVDRPAHVAQQQQQPQPRPRRKPNSEKK